MFTSISTNISILIFASTCKQITQSEPMEFSKNGVFHIRAVVITFSKCLTCNWKPIVYRNNALCVAKGNSAH